MSEAGTSLAALVRAAARRRPDAPAVVAGEQRLTWAELDEAVDRAAAGYAGAGPRAGQPGGRPAAQRSRLAARDPGCAARRPDRRPGQHGLHRPRARVRARRLLRGPAGRRRRARAGGRRARSAPGRPTADGPPPEVADDPAAVSFLCYTSGTTGRPRGAMLTAASLRANQEQCLAMDPPVVREDDRVLLVLPALPRLRPQRRLRSGGGDRGLRGPAGDLRPARALAVMAEEHVTAVPGAPPMYQAWLAAADAVGSDAELRRGFAAMRMASSGAAPLPEEVWTAMRDRAAVTVWEGYGLDRGRAGGRQHPGHRPRQAQLHRRRAARGRGAAAGHGRAGEAPGPSTTTTTATTTSRGRGRSGSAGPTCSPATGPTAPTARTPTAGWAPATSPTATPTATCTWSTGAAT